MLHEQELAARPKHPAHLLKRLDDRGDGAYGKVQSGEMDPVRFFKQVHDASPAWASTLLDGFGLESLGAVQEKLSAGLMAGTRLTEPTVTIILKNPNVPRREHFGRA
jgi:hypothetical protein